jgi:hypothetical protein
VSGKRSEGGEHRIELALLAKNQAGKMTTEGKAEVILPAGDQLPAKKKEKRR